MKQLRYFVFVFLFGMSTSLSVAAQINGWDIIKGLIELSENAAKLSDNCFQLTEDRMWAGGSIYYPAKIDLNSDFTMELDIFLGCKDLEGADGMVFVFSPKMAMGREGEGMGFGGVYPSIGIEIDTYQNEHLADPPADHIAILQHGYNHHRMGLTKPISLKKNIEDCQSHALKIDWKVAEKRLEVVLDGASIVSLQKDLVQDIFNGDSEVFWGVTSSTGGKSNEQKVCFEKINFRPASAIATSSFKKIETALLNNEVVALEQATFHSGKVALKEESYRELEELAALLKAQPEMYLGIYGHTDNVGNPRNNQRLSQKRADAIVDYLVQQGIPKERLLARGVGDQYPIASNADAVGRRKNRRVEVYFYEPYP